MINKIEHLYIHWPFCQNKCHYCDFISFEQHENFKKQYHEALLNEIRTFTKQPFANKPSIKTIFLGGGTPSLYPLPLMKELFETLNEQFCLKKLEEVTIEVNPEDATEERLKAWKSFGINRLSIGVQILDETILRKVNRNQTNKSVEKLLSIAPNYFENISVDLILGLPGATKEIWLNTLNQITKKKIKHISVYFLTVYEKTPLYFKVKDKSIKLPSESWMLSTYKKTIEYLKEKGFMQYEISNFAKPGLESTHNQAYWDRKQYKGFGLSAASFIGNKRLVNTNNLQNYLNCHTKNKLDKSKFFDCHTEETLTPENEQLEEVMLGLRQRKGVGLHRVVYWLSRNKKDTSFDKEKSLTDNKAFLEKSLKQKINLLKRKNLILVKNGCVFLTVRGMVLENEVILNLI